MSGVSREICILFANIKDVLNYVLVSIFPDSDKMVIRVKRDGYLSFVSEGACGSVSAHEHWMSAETWLKKGDIRLQMNLFVPFHKKNKRKKLK